MFENWSVQTGRPGRLSSGRHRGSRTSGPSARRGGKPQSPVADDDPHRGAGVAEVREPARVRGDARDRRVELVEGEAVAGPAVGGERAAPEADGADRVQARAELREDLSDRAG